MPAALTFAVSEEINEAVSDAARKHGISKSAFLRLFITQHVKQMKAHRIEATIKPARRAYKPSR